MAQDFIKGRGTVRSNKPDAGGANIRSVPVLGIVKDNVDPIRSGRIKVYLTDQPQSNADPDNSDNWVTVSYMSNYFGSVRGDAGEDGFGTYKTNPSSYGEWHSPPDIGTTVVCIFVNGDPNFGFYIGCVPDPEALYMVPAIGSSDNILVSNPGEADSFAGASRLPVTNINTNNIELASSPEFISSPRPVHTYSAAIMAQQGIIRDPIRGPISSSAQREASSRVGWGISTPGRPIYEGGFDDETVTQNLNAEDAAKLRVVARRGGHSIVMDDGDVIGRDQLIRIRTALGHQILMSDDGQTFMILHSNGQSYIELGKEGTVDIYSTNSINMRTQGDLNLHADNNVNIHANENLNVRGKNIHFESEEEFKLKAGKDIKTSTLGNFTLKSAEAIAMAAGGDASIAAAGDAYVNGAKVNLNSGEASTQPEDVESITTNDQTDTLHDAQKGFIASPGKLQTIVSRAPAHAPWADAGKGADVKVSLSSSDQLPKTPSTALAGVNNSAISTGPTPVSVATAVTAPNTSAVSKSMDKGTTGAVLGALAENASNLPNAQQVVKQGYGVINDPGSNQVTAAVGAFAQTPNQLANSGVIKPGSDRIVNAMIQSGKGVPQSMPNSLFTGKSGATGLTSLVQNVGSQASSVVTNLQKAQTALTKTGALTGNESSTQISGVVASGAVTGVASTINTIKQFTQSSVSNTGSGVINSSLKLIGSGAAAAEVAATQGGALGGLANSVKSIQSGSGAATGGSLNATLGVVGSAFSAIKDAFAPLQVGVPQKLSSTASKLLGAAGVKNVTGSNDLLSAAAKLVKSGSTTAASTVASGLDNLPGGASVASTTINKASNSTAGIPGVSGITDLINSSQNAAMNGLPSPTVPTGLNSLLSSATSNLLPGESAQLQSSVSSLGKSPLGSSQLPTTSVNTTDRSKITAQLDSAIGDPGIPKPNLSGEISQSAVSAAESAISEGKRSFEVQEQIESFRERIDQARKEFYEAESTFPAGDLGIERARDKWFKLSSDPEYLGLLSELDEVRGIGNIAPIDGLGQVATAPNVDFNRLNNSVNPPIGLPGSNINTAGNTVNNLSNVTNNVSNTQTISNTISGIIGDLPPGSG